MDDRILKATRRVLERSGAEALTVEAIAQEAGVGKPAIYRRYASKDEIVMSLSIANSVPHAEIDTGTFAGDTRELVAVLRESLKAMPRSVAGPQLGMAIADERASQVFMTNLAHAGSPHMQVLWDRGLERGEVDPDLDFLAAKTALGTSVIFSVLLYRMDPDGPEVDQIVEQWIRGVRPTGVAATGRARKA